MQVDIWANFSSVTEFTQSFDKPHLDFSAKLFDFVVHSNAFNEVLVCCDLSHSFLCPCPLNMMEFLEI